MSRAAFPISFPPRPTFFFLPRDFPPAFPPAPGAHGLPPAQFKGPLTNIFLSCLPRCAILCFRDLRPTLRLDVDLFPTVLRRLRWCPRLLRFVLKLTPLPVPSPRPSGFEGVCHEEKLKELLLLGAACWWDDLSPFGRYIPPAPPVAPRRDRPHGGSASRPTGSFHASKEKKLRFKTTTPARFPRLPDAKRIFTPFPGLFCPLGEERNFFYPG